MNYYIFFNFYIIKSILLVKDEFSCIDMLVIYVWKDCVIVREDVGINIKEFVRGQSLTVRNYLESRHDV